jgi:hypothetical protein
MSGISPQIPTIHVSKPATGLSSRRFRPREISHCGHTRLVSVAPGPLWPNRSSAGMFGNPIAIEATTHDHPL